MSALRTCNSGQVILARLLECGIDDLPKLLARIEVVSFDYFDTIMLWPYCSEGDCFRDAEQIYDCKGFYSNRKKAGDLCYRSLSADSEEITYDELYSAMPLEYAKMKSREMDFVAKSLIPNFQMCAVMGYLKSIGRRVVIVSDTYYPKCFLKSILDQHGFPLIDEMFLSCEYRKRKSTGNLFHKVLQVLNADSDRVLHIGDNLLSDVLIPSRLKISTVCYPHIVKRFCDRFCWLYGLIGGTDSAHIKWSKLVGIAAIVSFELGGGFWTDLGALIGGSINYSFFRWCYKQIESKGYDKVLLVARDAYVINHLFEQTCMRDKVQYFYAPRTVLYLMEGQCQRLKFAEKRCSEALAHLKRLPLFKQLGWKALKGKVLGDYGMYMKSIGSGNYCLIDGFSINHSSQKICENFFVAPVFVYHFWQRGNSDRSASFFFSKTGYPPWGQLVEFILGAPTSTIECIIGNNPIYRESESLFACERDLKRVEVLDATIRTAKLLQRYDLEVDGDMVLKLLSYYYNGLGSEDAAHLDLIKNDEGVAIEPILMRDNIRYPKRLFGINFMVERHFTHDKEVKRYYFHSCHLATLAKRFIKWNQKGE